MHTATGTFTAIDLSLCSPDILMEIDFMVESDSYGSDHFPIILKIGVSLPDALPRWNLNRADWVQFDHLCKEKLTLDTIELYAEPIALFTDVLCIIAKSCIPKTTAKQKKRCKPWFNTECKDAMTARKSALDSFKTNITSENLSNFRIARAKARRACRENKRASWQQYVSRLNSRTTLKSTWDIVRRISGKYKANTVLHLKSNTYDITDVKEICNTLAKQFAFNSSSDNYSHMFNRYRLKLEKNTIDFDTNEHYSHNDVFTLYELKQAIKVSRDTSPCIDTVHYQLLKHLPDDRLLLLLYIFNHIWLTHDFPTSWKTAIIIPVPKPGKVLSDPGSYWPVALTSCLCKTMARMVNSRLTWYLERYKVITEYQSGFRRRRPTVDNLVTLETSIRDAFVGRKHLVSIFFDLEKAYDTTWKHGILLDVYKTSLRGRLPMFSVIFYLIVILKFVSGTYSLILTHRRQVSHRVVFFPSHYLVSILRVLYLVYCLILNVPFM